MRNASRGVWLILLAAALSQAQPARRPGSRGDALSEQIIAQERAELDSLKTGDLTTFANLVADDAVFVDARGAAGKAEVVRHTAEFRLHEYSMADVRVVPVSRDSGLIVYKAVESGTSHGKEFRRPSLRFRPLAQARRPVDVRVQPGDCGEVGARRKRIARWQHNCSTTQTIAKFPSKTASLVAFHTKVGHLTPESALRNHAFTFGLADAQIAKLASLATEVTFAQDDVILADHRQSKYFYLVTSGSVAIELRTSTFTISVLAVGPGQAFGWSALLDRQDTLFQVRARERTVALRIAGADLTAACRSDPDLGVEILLRTLLLAAGRIRATEAKFAELCGVRVASSL